MVPEIITNTVENILLRPTILEGIPQYMCDVMMKDISSEQCWLRVSRHVKWIHNCVPETKQEQLLTLPAENSTCEPNQLTFVFNSSTQTEH